MAVRVLVAVTAMAVLVGGCSMTVTGTPTPGAAPETTQSSTRKPLPRPSKTEEPEPSRDAPSETEEAILAVAQTYVDAMNRQDDAAVAAITCSGGAPSLHQIAHPSSTFAVEPPADWNDGVGSGEVPLLVDGKPDTPLIIKRNGNAYCAWG